MFFKLINIFLKTKPVNEVYNILHTSVNVARFVVS